MTWATPMPILVFLGLSVLDLGPMYATDRQTDRRQTATSLNAPAYCSHYSVLQLEFFSKYSYVYLKIV